jgi:hypothetical protein
MAVTLRERHSLFAAETAQSLAGAAQDRPALPAQEVGRKLFLGNLPGQDYRGDAPARRLLAQVFENPVRAAPEQIEVQRHDGWKPVTEQCETVQSAAGRGHVKTMRFIGLLCGWKT